MKNNRPNFTIGIILTLILGFTVYFLVIYFQTDLKIAIYLFPWAFIGKLFNVALPSGFLLLGFFQLPIYGLLLDTFKQRKSKLIIIVLILISHLFLVKLISGYDTNGKKELIKIQASKTKSPIIAI